MSKSGFETTDDSAAALLSAWADSTGDDFRRETEKLFSRKCMNATLEALTGLTDAPFPIFEAIRARAGTVTGIGHDNEGRIHFRTDLFALTIQGRETDIRNSMLGALPHKLADEMKKTGYVSPNSTVFIFTAPLDPDSVARITPDALRWLTIQAHNMLTSRQAEHVDAVRRALSAFQIKPERKSRIQGINEAIVIGARLIWTRDGQPQNTDLLCPDLLTLDDDETQSEIRQSTERFSQGIERLLDESGLHLVLMRPLNFSDALHECAARRIAGWFAIEAVTLGLPYEGDVDALYIARHGENIMASAKFRHHLLGPVAVSRMLGGDDLESLAFSITNDEDKIVLDSIPAEFPGCVRKLN